MKPTKAISEEYLDRIICVAYGDAGFLDRIKIYLDARRDPEIKKILAEYRESAKKVHLISPEEYNGIVPVMKKRNINNWLLNYLYLFFKKPLISAAAVLMIIGGIAGYLIINANHSTPKYTEQELRIADQQAKESFALVASIFDRTKNELKNKIFNEKVNKPINKGLTLVYKYL
jgi:hypothetical protein